MCLRFDFAEPIEHRHSLATRVRPGERVPSAIGVLIQKLLRRQQTFPVSAVALLKLAQTGFGLARQPVNKMRPPFKAEHPDSQAAHCHNVHPVVI